MPSIDYNDLLAKLPHRDSMRLIDRVIDIDGMAIETLTEMDETRADFFGSESYWGIELIAQSGALPLIAASETDQTHSGVIVQVKSFRSLAPISPEIGTLITRCRVELLLDGAVAVVVGTVSAGAVLICEAEITLAMQLQ